MAYITYEQYVEIYGTPPISEEDFPVYAGLASDLIDSITRHQIGKGGGFSALAPFLQEQVRKATAAQVLYFTQYGLETVLTGQTGQAFTVGKVSVSGGSMSTEGGKTGALMISPMAVTMLEQTSLMERGVHVCSDRYLNPFFGI